MVTDDGKETDGQVSITDAAAAFNYWKKSLPAAGYAVSTAELVGSFGEVDFTGHGCRSGSQIAIQQSSALVQCVLR